MDQFRRSYIISRETVDVVNWVNFLVISGGKISWGLLIPLAGSFIKLTGLLNENSQAGDQFRYRHYVAFLLVLPWFLLTLCLEYNSKTLLNFEPWPLFCFCWNCFERIWKLQCMEAKTEELSLCWQVTGGSSFQQEPRVPVQRSCWPVSRGQEKRKAGGSCTFHANRKAVHWSGIGDTAYSSPCNFWKLLSFELFGWIQFQKHHSGPQVYESPLWSEGTQDFTEAPESIIYVAFGSVLPLLTFSPLAPLWSKCIISSSF